MLYRLQTFSGTIPRLYSTLLPKGSAEAAEDARFERGVMQPLPRSETLHTHTGTVTDFYRHTDGTFLIFDARKSVVPGPVATDRLYIAQAGAAPIIKLMPAGTEYPLAVDTPLVVPGTEISVAAPAPAEGEPPLQVETVVYVYTWVTSLDEESLPSPPSTPLDVTEGSTVRITFVDAPDPGTRIDRLRVYRSVTGASGISGYFFIKELNSGVTEFIHNIETDPPQELLPSADFDPPVSGLEGFTAMQNGIIAGFKGRDLYFCEPYQPHAWPAKYALQTDYKIVGLVAFGPNLAVLTEGQPYRVDGIQPDSMVMTRIDLAAPCVSAQSIADMGYSAVYAGPDGLIELTADGTPRNLTAGLYTRAQWRALDPSTIIGGHFHTNYVFTNDPGTGKVTKMIQMDPEPRVVDVSQAMAAIHRDTNTNNLLFSTGSTVRRFADPEGNLHVATWKSGPIIFTAYADFSVILIEGVELVPEHLFAANIYADDVLIHTVTALNEVDRLPPIPAKKWQIELQGKVDVFRVSMASAYDELIA